MQYLIRPYLKPNCFDSKTIEVIDVGRNCQNPYIVGSNHGGTTVFGNILGQTSNFIHVGELKNVLGRPIEQYGLCGCGKPHFECDFWQAVFQESFGGTGPPNHAVMRSVLNELRAKGVFRSTLPGNDWDNIPHIDEFADASERLYRAIQKVSGCSIIVDTSKSLPHNNFLALRLPFNWYSVQLTRDPRGVAYSLFRKYRGSITRKSIMTARAWMILHLAIELSWHRHGQIYNAIRVRYEDLISRPARELERVNIFAKQEVSDLSFVHEDYVNIEETHTFRGNRMRFQNGPIKLQLDVEWLTKMSHRAKAVTTILALPLLGKYDYPIFPANHYRELTY